MRLWSVNVGTTSQCLSTHPQYTTAKLFAENYSIAQICNYLPEEQYFRKMTILFCIWVHPKNSTSFEIEWLQLSEFRNE